MDGEPGPSWADSVSKILRMGKVKPESNKVLSKGKREHYSSDEDEERPSKIIKLNTCLTKRLKPDVQKDALLEKELNQSATRGVVHLFNAVKTVNPKSDKKIAKKKKKKRKLKKGRKMKRR